MRKRPSVRREAPLAVCPLPGCRRAGTCRHDTAADPCRRLHETQAAFYTELARKIDRIKHDMIARRPPGAVVEIAREGTPEFERRLKSLYDDLRETDQASAANQLARQARERAERQAKREKPATPPKGA